MTSAGDGGKAGTVGDLYGKSVAELMEMLERQEKLLNNQKFIARLPDRGKKIRDYTEKLMASIAEHKRVKEKADLLSKFKLGFEEQQNVVKEKTRIALPVDKKTLASPATKNKNSNSTANVSETNKPTTMAILQHNTGTGNPLLPVETSSKESSLSISKEALHEKDKSKVDNTVPLTADTVSEISHKTNVDASSSSVQEHTNQKNAKNDTGATEDLVDNLKMISIRDSAEKESDSSETSNKPKNPAHPFTMQQSHYLEVIEKRQRSPVHRKEKFQTNRLPSDSDCSTPNQSPGERALRLSVEERRAQDRKHLDDITAARLPALHHSPALLLPLDESLTLQTQQKKSYEEKQAKLAAQKLFEKLNIKMGPFNPEGDSYMKYRDQRDDEGYDAEE